MKKIIIAMLLLITVGAVTAQNQSDRLIGSWSGKDELKGTASTNVDVSWYFLAEGIGSVNKKSNITARGSFVCDFNAPFTWTVQADALVIVYGTATCSCLPPPFAKEEDAVKRETEIANAFSNKTVSYTLTFIDSKQIKIGNTALMKK